MARSFHEDIGELRARVAAVEAEMQGLRHDVREIRDALIGLRGGWRLLTVLVAVSATLGAAASKFIPFLTWPKDLP